MPISAGGGGGGAIMGSRGAADASASWRSRLIAHAKSSVGSSVRQLRERRAPLSAHPLGRVAR
eukprot:8329411-Pyramimonas_sp.AAC.1